MRAILTYHSIDPSGSPISIHPDAFDQHLSWLTSGRVTVTSPEQLLALPPTADAVAITFDDGFVNFAERAAPRLLEYGMPVTLFVVTDHVGATNMWGGLPRRGIPSLPLLDWPALVRLREQGVVLGAHSRTHPDLTRVGPVTLQQEVRGSADIIESRGGTRPTLFAYPYGRLNDEAAALVADVFSHACTTEHRALDATAEAVRLPRLDMYYFQQAGALDGWGTPAFERAIGMRRQLRRVRQWLG